MPSRSPRARMLWTFRVIKDAVHVGVMGEGTELSPLE